MNPARKLDVITNDMPEPPYPADVRAKGWHFSLDIERIKQSATWMLAPREMHNPLIRLWMESWTQSPCGSLPSHDDLIAAHIEMDPRIFAAHRDILLRQWYLATDGRLYHPVITEMVERMRDGRRSERERKAKQRANVPPVSGGTATDSTRSPTTGTGTVSGTGTGKSNTPPRKRAGPAAAQLQLLLNAGVNKAIAEQWLDVRKAKKLVLTDVAMEALAREASKVGMSVPDAVVFAIERSWGGFLASWVLKERNEKAGGAKGTSFTRDREQQATAWMGSLAPKKADVIDMEDGNA